MKKILSFILALTLCIGLLPTFAFAADAGEFTVDFSVFEGITQLSSTKKQYWMGKKDYGTAYGDGWTSIKDSSVSTVLTLANTVVRFYPSSYMQMNYTKTGNNNGNNVFAVDINVPDSGIYDISVNAGYVKTAGGMEILIDDKKIGATIDFADTAETAVTMSDVLVAEGVYLSAGTRRLKLVGKDNGVVNTDDTQAVYVKALTFTPSEGAFAIDFTTVDTSTLTDGNKLSKGGTAAGSGWSAETRDSVSNILSGTNHVRFNATDMVLYAYNNTVGTRNTMVFYIEVPETGLYDISLNAGYSNGVGIFDIELGGGNIASGLNFYRDTATAEYENTDLAQGVLLRKGANTLRIIAKGRPEAGESGSVGASLKYFTFTKSTATDVSMPENDTVSFAVTTNIPGATPSVKSLTRGEKVDLSKHLSDDPAYELVGWMRGAYTDENVQNESSWVEIEDNTYNVWTNTFLTAVYKPVADDAETVVEFWNQNGAYLGSATEETYAAASEWEPTLTGFSTFRGWFVDEEDELPETFDDLSAGTTNAVAQYYADVVSGVKLDGTLISNDDNVSGDGTFKYNTPIELPAENENFTCWKRDGEIISYEKTYKFYAWDETNIEESTEAIGDKKTPVAILEYSAERKAFMFEYDQGATEIFEAGIILNKGTVNAKTYTSQNKSQHNQFTVPADADDTATGYIIYRDAFGGHRTKYFEVKEN